MVPLIADITGDREVVVLHHLLAAADEDLLRSAPVPHAMLLETLQQLSDATAPAWQDRQKKLANPRSGPTSHSQSEGAASESDWPYSCRRAAGARALAPMAGRSRGSIASVRYLACYAAAILCAIRYFTCIYFTSIVLCLSTQAAAPCCSSETPGGPTSARGPGTARGVRPQRGVRWGPRPLPGEATTGLMWWCM